MLSMFALINMHFGGHSQCKYINLAHAIWFIKSEWKSPEEHVQISTTERQVL